MPEVGRSPAHEPDARIAVRLRAELARNRQDGLCWSREMFQDCVSYALVAAPDWERASWRSVFRWAEDHWRDGYQREGGAFRRGLPTLD